MTKYFYDSVPRDMLRQEPGKYRCQVLLKDGQRCDHEISDTDCCKGNFCWTPLATAPLQMDEHVRTVHGAAPPPRRQWSSSLFAFEGWGEACLCGPCLGARQVTAVAGWEDTFHCGWCFLFSFFGLGRVSFYPAIMARIHLIALNNIDEHCCSAFWISVCCFTCSLAQTQRELSASGVWPGSSCGNGVRPSNYASLAALEPRAGKVAMI